MKRRSQLITQGYIIDKQYMVQSVISEGTFGQVFEGLNLKTKEKVAIKIEIQAQLDTLSQEHLMLLQLQGVQGVPQVVHYSQYEKKHILITPYLEKDLSSFARIYKKLSLKTVIQMSIQLMSILVDIHSRGIIHRDIKPDNITFKKGKFYLIDFGISKLFLDKGKQRSFKTNKSFVGTKRYASIAAHRGHEQSPKDDYESLLYVLIFLYRGFVPWEMYRKNEDILESKIKALDSHLFQGMPRQFNLMLTYLRSLGYSDLPNVGILQEQIITLATENNIILDDDYEWTPKHKKLSSLSIGMKTTHDIYWIDDTLVNHTTDCDEDHQLPQLVPLYY